MPSQTKNSKRSSQDPWVPAGIVAANARKSHDSEAEEWLPSRRRGSNGQRNGRNGHARLNRASNGLNGASNGNGASHRSSNPLRSFKPRRRRKLPNRATARERWLITRLRRSKRRVEEQREEVDRLQRRIAELEDAAVHRATSHPKAERRPKAERKKTKPAPKRVNGNRRNGTKAANGKRRGKLDLNEATFDELRDLGLSITQTSRLISYRETARGFGSVDELADVPGLAKATLTNLRSQVRVGAR